jgi:hypothetical protein
MKKFFKLIGAVIAALVAFMHDKAEAEKVNAARQQREVEEYNAKIDKARKDAAAEFDARGGVPDETDPNLRD